MKATRKQQLIDAIYKTTQFIEKGGSPNVVLPICELLGVRDDCGMCDYDHCPLSAVTSGNCICRREDMLTALGFARAWAETELDEDGEERES